jgi:nitrile hydratase subunit beta
MFVGPSTHRALNSFLVNGIHDMGGMHGFGRVVVENDEPVFHAEWEGKVRAMYQETVGLFYNMDEFRHTIERMEPTSYLEAAYYERWLYAVESLLDEKGVLSAHELSPREAVSQRPPELRPARFQPGDPVRARNMHPEGHTRLPRYVRGKR